ncbi:hypothetical protein [Halorussus halophilus]|uniref:hypothetical protein n=1 Tax=Halorussus halophilus TaxID=2650975 RepID=UPI0013015475|nr:hypothetical protein [Halorussus halophilus]
MGGKKAESCGRCAMSSVVSMTTEDEESEPVGHNPFEGERIEVSEDEMELVHKPQILLGRLKQRIDDVATKLTYGR